MTRIAERTPELLAAQRRPWRFAFVLYALAITIATHWPAFELAPQVPATDTTIHLLAFGMATFLLWRTAWIRHLTVLAAIVITWSSIDEWTQGAPGINRHVAIMDGVANALGVLLVVVWLWAMRPAGGPVSRRRSDLLRFTLDEVFRRPRIWIQLAGAGVACALPITILWFTLEAGTTRRLILLGLLAWAVTAQYLIFVHGRAQLATIDRERPCFHCGRPTEAADVTGGCPACGTPLMPDQWTLPALPRPAVVARLIGWPVVGVLMLLAAGVVAVYLGIVSNASLPEGSPFARAGLFLGDLIGGIPHNATFALDLALCLFLLAAATAVYRRRLARYVDESAICRACGHDLRGTPANDGIGQCGECGASFERASATG